MSGSVSGQPLDVGIDRVGLPVELRDGQPPQVRPVYASVRIGQLTIRLASNTTRFSTDFNAGAAKINGEVIPVTGRAGRRQPHQPTAHGGYAGYS